MESTPAPRPKKIFSPANLIGAAAILVCLYYIIVEEKYYLISRAVWALLKSLF